MHKWATDHQIDCSLVVKSGSITGYGEKALLTPAKIVDTKACADKIVQVLKQNPNF